MTSPKKQPDKTAQPTAAAAQTPIKPVSVSGLAPVLPAPAAPSAPVEGEMLTEMPLAQLQAAVTQAMAAVGTIRSLLPNPVRLSATQRKETPGRMRAGEAAVLEGIASVAEMPAYAPLVTSLADLDYGDDPNAFEPTLLSSRLKAAEALSPLVDALESLGQDLGDTTLELNALGRPPLLEAYAIFKSVAKTNPGLMAQIKDAIDFYGSFAKAAAKARAAKKATPTTPTTPTKPAT
jgi:hypothetical protein